MKRQCNNVDRSNKQLSNTVRSIRLSSKLCKVNELLSSDLSMNSQERVDPSAKVQSTNWLRVASTERRSAIEKSQFLNAQLSRTAPSKSARRKLHRMNVQFLNNVPESKAC